MIVAVTEPVITYETRPAPALQFIVNFGVFTGREATHMDIRRLAEALLAVLPSVTVFSEHRLEVGTRSEVDLHQVRVEVAHEALPTAEHDVDALRAGLSELIAGWARACLTSFPGELTEPEIAARDAVVEINQPVRGKRTVERIRTGAPVAGVDGYRGGWVAVVLDAGGRLEVRTARGFDELLGLSVDVIAVDIPISLPESAPRLADVDARRFVGRRASSVFPTPPRAVLEAETFAEACERAQTLTGKAISRQSFALRKRILELDTLAEQDERIVEVHPEVSFCTLAGRPLLHSKHTPEGLAERRELLEAAGVELPAAPRGVPEADLLDAAVAAWTAARYAHEDARPLPAHHRSRIGAIWS
jgi:predicted RNase H-like nuclease